MGVACMHKVKYQREKHTVSKMENDLIALTKQQDTLPE